MQGWKVILIAPLGHGRAVESLLALAAFIYGMMLLLFPAKTANVEVTFDIAWMGYARIMAYPFLFKALMSGLGVYGNIRGWKRSRYLRITGAVIGSFLWTWYASKCWAVGTQVSLGWAASLVFCIGSLRVMAMASIDLPKPSAAALM